jgi:hypothetical protein
MTEHIRDSVDWSPGRNHARLPGTLAFVAWFAATAWLVGRGTFAIEVVPDADLMSKSR